MVHLPEKQFRREVDTLLRYGISSDYVGHILDFRAEEDGLTIFDLIKEDVETTSAWEDEGYYNEDDIRLAVGRVLMSCLYKMKQLYFIKEAYECSPLTRY